MIHKTIREAWIANKRETMQEQTAELAEKLTALEEVAAAASKVAPSLNKFVQESTSGVVQAATTAQSATMFTESLARCRGVSSVFHGSAMTKLLGVGLAESKDSLLETLGPNAPLMLTEMYMEADGLTESAIRAFQPVARELSALTGKQIKLFAEHTPVI